MSEIKIVRGNTFAVRTHVRAFRLDGTEIDDFDLSACTDVKVMARTAYSRKELKYAIQEDNNMRVVFPAAIQHVGCYGLEVTGKYNDVEWRFYDRDILAIVETNEEAEIPQSSIIDHDFYEIEMDEPYLRPPYDDTAVWEAIHALEDSVAATNDSVIEQGDAIAALGERIGRVEERLTTLEGSVTSLTGQMSALSERVAALETFAERTAFVIFPQ